MLMYRNTTLVAKILRMKPPLTSTAPVMEVTLHPSLVQATEAMGATEVTGEGSAAHSLLFVEVKGKNDTKATRR